MRKLLFISLLCLIFGNAFSQFQNVLIEDKGLPEEPTISINLKDPSIVMAASNIDLLFISTDSGYTWTDTVMGSDYGVWGDPVLINDTAGNFHFFHLANPPNGNWIDRIVSQRYVTEYGIWDVDTFMGLNGTKAQDKEWAVVDRTNNNIYISWTEFDDYGSSNPNDSSRIMFSKSTNGGLSWSQAKQINEVSGNCIDSDNTTEGAVPAVGPNGGIYIAWAGPEGLVFDRSMDQGNTWLDNDIHIDNMPGGWDFDIPGLMRCNGLPITKCDLSSGPHRGTIYVNWTDQRNGSDNTDVWLAKSTDGGNTWSNPRKVNNDTLNRHQFFTWMDVDQTTGYLYFVFYDRRNYTDERTDVFMAISKDGGASFQNYQISDTPFIPVNTMFFGDYNNIHAHNGMIRPIWTRADTGYLSVWTAIIDDDMIIGLDENQIAKSAETKVYPNPADDLAIFAYKIRRPTNLKLSVLNSEGKLIEVLKETNNHKAGKFMERFHPENYNLPSGIYYFKLEYGNKIKTEKFVVE